MKGTEAQHKVMARIAKVELSILSFGPFLRAIRIGLVKRLSFGHSIKVCNGQGVLMKAPGAMFKRFDFGFLWLTGRIDVDPALALVAVARQCGVD